MKKGGKKTGYKPVNDPVKDSKRMFTRFLEYGKMCMTRFCFVVFFTRLCFWLFLYKYKTATTTDYLRQAASVLTSNISCYTKNVETDHLTINPSYVMKPLYVWSWSWKYCFLINIIAEFYCYYY